MRRAPPAMSLGTQNTGHNGRISRRKLCGFLIRNPIEDQDLGYASGCSINRTGGRVFPLMELL
jgi:hypothetical protein